MKREEEGHTGRWPRPGNLGALLTAVVLVAGCVLALTVLRPPAARGTDAPDAAFSAARAMEHVEELAAEPRPTGSDAAARARRHLASAARSVGARVEVTERTVADPGAHRLARVHNVVAHLPGSAPTGAVLLMAHYDSKPQSPGAADNAAGVAALLEVLRVLAAETPPRNDVYVLFSDGEEIGLLGAQAFARQHPAADDVALVINLEARGTRGPSLLFETAQGDGPLIATWADVAPRPIAASYAYDVYRLLPYDTDFTVFRNRNGFNLAFIHGHTAYHTSLDRADRLDPRSLQHHGDQTLALGRHFAAADLATLPQGGPRVYFNLPLLGLVVYPASWALPLAVVGAVLAAVVLGLLLARRRLRPGDLAIGAATVTAATVAALLTVFLGHRLLALLFSLRADNLGEGTLYAAAWMLVAAAVTAAVQLVVARRRGALRVAAGGLGAWSLLTLAAAAVLPASSYLFTWPLFAAVAAVVTVVTTNTGDLLRSALVALLCLPAVLLWLPCAALLNTALVPGLGGTAVVVGGLAVALTLATLTLQLDLLAAGRPAVLAGAGLAVGLVLALVAAAGAGYDAERPRSASVAYFLDADRSTAIWFTFDPVAPWNQGLFAVDDQVLRVGGLLDARFADSQALTAAAPVYDLAPPAAELLETTSRNGARRLRLRVDSQRDAPELRIDLTAGGGFSELSLDGVEVDPPANGKQWFTNYHGLPEEGVELEVTVAGDGPLEVELVDRSAGWPAAADLPSRPAGLIAGRLMPTDLTAVRHRATFAPGDAPAETEVAAGTADDDVTDHDQEDS